MPRVSISTALQLQYYRSEEGDSPIKVGETWMVSPGFTDELRVAVFPNDDSYGVPAELTALGRLQVQLSGTPRALEELGRYLVGLARLQTEDEDPHNHFEDVHGHGEETVHLMVRRRNA